MASPRQFRPGSASFFAARQEGECFEPTSQMNQDRANWRHDDLVRQLLGNTSLTSVVGIHAGRAEGTDDFVRELEVPKQDATIHLPSTEYIVPAWAVQFAPVIKQIVEYEHATNSRANQQLAQLRVKQHDGRPYNSLPHLDAVGSRIRNYHLYLVPSQLPPVTFGGTFTYELPLPYEGMEQNPVPLFKALDPQFARQIEGPDITTLGSNPFDIIGLSALTVHKAHDNLPLGRTLLGIEFYELIDGIPSSQSLE